MVRLLISLRSRRLMWCYTTSPPPKLASSGGSALGCANRILWLSWLFVSWVVVDELVADILSFHIRWWGATRSMIEEPDANAWLDKGRFSHQITPNENLGSIQLR